MQGLKRVWEAMTPMASDRSHVGDFCLCISEAVSGSSLGGFCVLGVCAGLVVRPVIFFNTRILKLNQHKRFG